ncbi:cell envelope integrity protein CreD [Helicobacter sp. MIT 05-5294]|uniref:cell envelope integrity protein CreD n=1 Tax=Helicobacter sp. MIT 05-5294 TaxID=1548150 RepID=UPI0010FD2A66|nr:cell envelope integrity protein CreD [Helicobacter sp. MIT 05-5294]TLD86204.1 hypothetical protein LS69_006850 [Helicobacter sp. MIT 05-5294]
MINLPKSQTSNYTKKTLLLFLLSLLLLIPLMMFDSISRDRQYNAKEAMEEIGKDWGDSSVLFAPVIVIPYNTNENKKKFLHITPETYNAKVVLKPQQRKRGIYEAVIYEAETTFEAEFDFDLYAISQMIDSGFVTFNIENIALNLPYMRKSEIISLSINQSPVSTKFTKPNHIPLASSFGDLRSVKITINGVLSMRGHSSFEVQPSAQKNTLEIESTWKNPSFSSLLPNHHSVDSKGFKATYTTGNENSIFSFSNTANYQQDAVKPLKINLYQGITEYRLIDRAVKYAYLFIALTFLALFLCEIASGKSVILLQYGLIGASLVVFYLSLLSFSEHLGFAIAYVLSSLSVIVPISLYTFSIMGEKRFAYIIGCIMVFLYVSLFLMLFQDAYALLIGTFIVMFALYAAMFLTRHLNKPQEMESKEDDKQE